MGEAGQNLPQWKRVRQGENSLVSVCLRIIGRQPKVALHDWEAKERRLLEWGCRGSASRLAFLKASILAQVRKAKTMEDGAPPLGFFSPTESRLDLRGGVRFSHTVLKQVMLRMPNLKIVNLSGCFYVNDSLTALLAQRCPGISSLTLEGCRRITDATIDTLISKYSRLQCLALGGCFNLTAAAIRRLLSSHPNRSNWLDLRVSGLEGVDDESLEEIASQCQQLRRIAVGYTGIGDTAILQILKACSSLREIHLHWCDQLSDDGLLRLIKAAPKLEHLNIMGCKKVTDDSIRTFIAFRAPLRAKYRDAAGSEPDLQEVEVTVTAASGGRRKRGAQLVGLDPAPAKKRQVEGKVMVLQPMDVANFPVFLSKHPTLKVFNIRFTAASKMTVAFAADRYPELKLISSV